MASPAAILTHPPRKVVAKAALRSSVSASTLTAKEQPVSTLALPADTKGKLAYTILEAGDALGVKKSLIYNMVRDGRLKMVKLGTRSLIPAENLRALLASLPDAQAETSRAA